MSRRTECSRLRERLGEWNIWITLLPGVKQVNASLRDSSVKQVNALNAPQTLNFYFTVSFLSCACLRVTFFSRTWRRYWCLENTTIQWFLELKDKNAKCLDISMSAWKLLCSSTWRGWVRPTQIVGPSFAHFSRMNFFDGVQKWQIWGLALWVGWWLGHVLLWGVIYLARLIELWACTGKEFYSTKTSWVVVSNSCCCCSCLFVNSKVPTVQGAHQMYFLWLMA